MEANAAVDVVIVGSIGLDTITTPFESQEEILGGSVSYACAAASFFAHTGMVGIVGTDFPESAMASYRGFGIDLEGLEQVKGETFRWSGIYDADMINRETRSTDLNVFADFSPTLPPRYQNVRCLMLGNIAPELQLHVLSQVKPEFVIADTMDLWINIADEALQEVISKVDMLMLNDSEARLLTQKYHLRDCAASLLQQGPSYIVIKKGEHGAMLFTKDSLAIVPAYPVDRVVDPTGAGDSFAGGFIGYVASQSSINADVIRQGLFYGSVVASFGVEAFSVARLEQLSRDEIEERTDALKDMIRF